MPGSTRMVSGSSPLTRGKRAPLDPCRRRGRLIPAHAGKTPDALPRVRSRTAHPRSRGENGTMPGSTRMVSGSSPLTRGKRAPLDPCRRRGRLIPAHAGKTPARAKGQRLRAAHPRSRGENRFHDRGRGHGYGSSPLTRGKLFITIPSFPPPVAHPRSRGENVALLPPDMPIGGSSPLTRGKQGISSQLARPHRLIPAHAGKTPARRRQGPAGPAHPRSRGENIRDPPGPAPPVGSSPLTRGKPVVIQETASDVGLIPAHAGKTQASLTA